MYPVDLHMHTVASTHAYSTLQDYITEAKQKGLSFSLLPIMALIWMMRRTIGTSLTCVSGHALWMA
jgi:putative hydrolase